MIITPVNIRLRDWIGELNQAPPIEASNRQLFGVTLTVKMTDVLTRNDSFKTSKGLTGGLFVCVYV